MDRCKKIIDHGLCTGCGNCAAVCARGCFVMERDPAGFRRSALTEDAAARCLHCGRCEAVCPEAAEPHGDFFPADLPGCYALWHRDREVVLNSASGGAFYALAETVLEHGGVVGGVCMQENRSVYRFAATSAELAEFQGSKYVAPETAGVFEQTLSFLTAGKTVLISLLPCSAAALHLYLKGRSYSGQLLVVDLICSGVPSPRFLERELPSGVQIDRFARKNGRDFWRKTRGLSGRDRQGKPFFRASSRSPFYGSFGHAQNLRKSCYNCRHTGFDRHADLTLADFWGEKRFPEQEKYGISLALVHTPAGRKLLEDTRPRLVIHTASLTTAIEYNPRLTQGRHPAQVYQLVRSFPWAISHLPMFLVNLLYGGRHRFLGKLPYHLLWPKKHRARRRIEKENQALSALIRGYVSLQQQNPVSPDADDQRKFGILTFHGAASYGAVLQCFALQETLKKHFPDAEVGVIDCRPAAVRCAAPDSVFADFVRRRLNRLTPQTEILSTALTDRSVTDAVTGSDQVWNPKIVKTAFPDYLLATLPARFRKLAYAASFGEREPEFSAEEESIFRQALSRFDHLSVREESAAEICRRYGRGDAAVMPDPTLAAAPAVYAPLLDPGIPESVCGYFLTDSPWQQPVLQALGRHWQCRAGEVVQLGGGRSDNSGVTTLTNLPVEGFVSRIAKAKCVVTESFHGVCFALIFHRNFIVLPSKNAKRFTRIEELLTHLHLTDRIVADRTPVSAVQTADRPIDYAAVEALLTKDRQRAAEFLRQW